MLSVAQRAEVAAIFPKLREDPDTGYGQTARRVLTKRETEKLVARMRDNAEEFQRWDADLEDDRSNLDGNLPHLRLAN